MLRLDWVGDGRKRKRCEIDSGVRLREESWSLCCVAAKRDKDNQQPDQTRPDRLKKKPWATELQSINCCVRACVRKTPLPPVSLSFFLCLSLSLLTLVSKPERIVFSCDLDAKFETRFEFDRPRSIVLVREE